MFFIYNALYDLLCYITEDARAHKLNINSMPPAIFEQMNKLAIDLGKWLDEMDRLDVEKK